MITEVRMSAALHRRIETLTRANTPSIEEVPLQQDGTVDDNPTLLQKIKHEGSVLSLAVSDEYIFAGTQRNNILVWDIHTYERRGTLKGHQGAVLCLTLSEDKKTLFSSAGDAIVKVWDAVQLKPLYIIYSTFDIGDVFSVVYAPSVKTVYLGAQNTSIQWYDLSQIPERPRTSSSSFPMRRFNKFFDSQKPDSPDQSDVDDDGSQERVPLLEIEPQNQIQFAHYGYVYCLHLGTLPHSSEQLLFSGGGDGDVKIWSLDMKLQQTLSASDDGVLTMIHIESLLYAGSVSGTVNLWDLDTMQMIRSVRAHQTDVLSLSGIGDFAFSGSARGYLKKWDLSRGFDCVNQWQAHAGTVLSSTIGGNRLITGGNDCYLAIWDISACVPAPQVEETNIFFRALSKLVSLETISGCIGHQEECRRGATFLKNLLKQLGAIDCQLLPNPVKGRNPIVLGKFRSKGSKAKGLMFYGHYDVVTAMTGSKEWTNNPFNLSGRDGFYYGRGVSDNKGPVLAAMFAASELLQQGKDINITFLVEGEEECGSRGFAESVKLKKDVIGPVDWIFLSNSYWLDDEFPCLTYGLRGVIHAAVEISSGRPDTHSGVEGGSIREPLIDLINLLSCLTDKGRVTLNGFYDDVRPLTPAEEKLYEAITKKTHQETSTLMSRWRFPSLTVHKIVTTGSSQGSVIPNRARALISIRIVPDQKLEHMVSLLKSTLYEKFKESESDNSLFISIEQQVDWWLGDPENKGFKALEKAVAEEWRIDPLHIREGGSIPSLRWLEKEFNAHAVNFPMGQSSDNAHLVDERLRVLNLERGQRILEKVFSELSI